MNKIEKFLIFYSKISGTEEKDNYFYNVLLEMFKN